jgi:hypothetical protein
VMVRLRHHQLATRKHDTLFALTFGEAAAGARGWSRAMSAKERCG